MQNTLNDKNFEITIALAAICQAAALVKQVARNGQANPTAYQSSIESIVITDSDKTEQVFGQLANLELGYSTLKNQIGNQANEKDTEITRYIANLIGLERKLSGKSKMMAELADRVSQIKRQQQHMELLDHQVIKNLASIYSDVISPVGTKIQVSGNPALLQQNDNQHKVRALLLAGVRAAVLWRQLGGKRRHILLKRQSILASTEQALSQIKFIH
jgi:high frequency lysogenization protein